jgi:oxygen-independent coproporphyrinogen-3 oxidase
VNLYVHVPFCARRCSYCDFAIAVRREVPAAAFVAAVSREWDAVVREEPWASDPHLDTIYLGGGTPSRLGAAALRDLLQVLRRARPLTPGAEVTIEANPEDVTGEAARAWVDMGINRVSLGVQSFNDAVLAWMHRTHDAAQVPRAMHALRGAGVSNISIDLIFALPAALKRDWIADLQRALDLDPDHVALYGLTVEARTPLERWTTRGAVRPASDEQYAEEYLTAHAALGSAGFRHYEVSNAARPGREAVHNSGYWRRTPFLGLGPSAHSGVGVRRWWNVRHWAAYESRMTGGQSAVEHGETLDAEAEGLESLYLSLRTGEGVPAAAVGNAGSDWVRNGWAVAEQGRVRLTAEGWLRLDALVASIG